MRRMEKGRYQYFPVVQNSEKAMFQRSFVYVNKREWTDPNGIFQAATCRSISPGANGIYVVDTEGEYAKEKLAVLNAAVKEGIHPIIGPFDSIEDAVVAERKVRPLSDKEKLARADADAKELETLRREKAELQRKSRPIPA
jgi:hypothetical protein